MNQLSQLLGAVFATRRRKPDPHRKAREESRCLAAARGFEIERLKDGGFNVWPPSNMTDPDPHAGDHFCNDWPEVLEMARVYGASK